MRRCLTRIGLGLAIVLGGTGGLAWYVREFPWRNSCGRPAVAAALPPGATSAVATSHPLATRAAADVLMAGGTAADAAVAAALMLAVAEPGNSGLGGGGFALLHDPATGRDVALDFRERAPLAVDTGELRAAVHANPRALRDGALAVAVPALWPGLVELHRRSGRLPLSRLAAPAAAAARDGIAIGREYVARCWLRWGALRGDPEARRLFLTRLGAMCPLPGWILRQPDLAGTLRALTNTDHPASWADIFGERMVAFLASKGSRISRRDLLTTAVVERPVVTGRFLRHRIVSVGPPAGGLVVLDLLQTYEQLRERLPRANAFHLWTEASRLAFRDRSALLGDPEFVDVPVDRLASADHAREHALLVTADGALALSADGAQREGTHTTHVSVIDREGMAVAMTLSINIPFGSGLVVPGTGVLLNDEMDDFEVAGPNAPGPAGTAVNAPAPGKRPLSSMSPTFVYDERGLAAVLGSPGGTSIPTAVAWVVREMIEGGRTPAEAVRSPRIHHQWSPDVLQVEPRFQLEALPPWLAAHRARPPFPIGRVQMVALDGAGWRGVSDCRDEGEAWQGSP